MGRGKSKAKQTKVARELKYGSSISDLEALETELKNESSKNSETYDEADQAAIRE